MLISTAAVDGRDDMVALFVDGFPLGTIQVESIRYPHPNDEFGSIQIDAVARGVNFQQVPEIETRYGYTVLMTSIGSSMGPRIDVLEEDTPPSRWTKWLRSYAR